MTKTFKISAAAALAISALTPVAVFAAPVDTAAQGFYTTDTYITGQAFRALPAAEKAALLKSSETVMVVDGKVYFSKDAIGKTQAQLDASAMTETAFEAVHGELSSNGYGEVVGELKVESVSAINTTGVDVVLDEVTVAQEDVTIEVKDPSGNIIEVKAINLEVGDSEVTFEFKTALTEVALGDWKVSGLTFDTKAQAAVQAVIAANTEVKLWTALQSPFFKDAVVENITAYDAALALAIAADEVNTVADVQAIIAEVNADNLTEAEEEAAVEAVADATNQVTLLAALQNSAFKRVNADWIGTYETATASIVAGNAVSVVQSAIDGVNTTRVGNAITDATAAGVLDLAKIATAKDLVNKFIEDDAEGVTTKAGHLTALALHEAVVNVSLANTNAKLNNALNTLDGLTAAFDAATVNPNELTRYRTDISNTADGAKDIAAEIKTIVDAANVDAEAAAVAKFATVDADTTTAQLKVLLATLADRSAYGSDDFDMKTVIDALLPEYKAAILLTPAMTDAADIQTIITTSNAPGAALDLIDAASSEALLLTALKSKTLNLANVVDANKAFYHNDLAAFKTAADSSAMPVSDSVTAVKLLVDATNAKVELNAATTSAAAQAALTKFAIATNNTAYINLSSTAKLEVAGLVLAAKPATVGYGANSTVTSEIGTQISAHAALLSSVNTAGDIGAMNTALKAIKYAAYSTDLNESQRIAVAEAFLASFPTDKDGVKVAYATLTNIKAGIDAAITAVAE